MEAHRSSTLDERVDRMEPVAVEPAARNQLLELISYLTSNPAKLQLVVGEHETHDLPDEATALLKRVLKLLAQGDGATVVSTPEELTTQQAADILNVSRQYLVRLIDAGEIPASRVNSHRRLQARDVLTFKAIRDAKRHETLSNLVKLTAELGGYEAEMSGLKKQNEPER